MSRRHGNHPVNGTPNSPFEAMLNTTLGSPQSEDGMDSAYFVVAPGGARAGLGLVVEPSLDQPVGTCRRAPLNSEWIESLSCPKLNKVHSVHVLVGQFLQNSQVSHYGPNKVF